MAKLTTTQQAVLEKMRAGAVLTSVNLGRRSGAEIQFPDENAERVSIATVRALSRNGEIIIAGKRGPHSTWTVKESR